MSVRSVFLFALAASIACASATTTAGGVRHDSNVITEQEISASAGSNAFEVVSRLRPSFLKSRGKSTVSSSASEFATVYMDGQQLGGISTLRNIVASQVKQIRYYNLSDATTRFGMQNGSGVIEVTTR
ncbi:MAG: hypothetical protein M3Z18_10510 [Gemmatimonadota bacterium]|nr:hypothetical protein [Gemmatimonadota bacterium]